jgi:phosphodiesterase/alkaline phosphatase D-like protein
VAAGAQRAADLLIYRSFSFGNLVALHMLDTRVIAREEPLDYTASSPPPALMQPGFTAAVARTSRQLLGATQTSGCSSRWLPPLPPGRCWASRC